MSTTAGPATAAEMQRALYRHFAPKHAVLFEISTDLRNEPVIVNGHEHPWKRRRRIDALLARPARKKGIGPIDLLAVEIKVTRSDFLADIREPEKQAPWREVAHRHAYAVPAGLVQPGEVPAGSGLLTVGARCGRHVSAGWAKRAPYSQTPEIPSWLTMTLAWRLSAAEAKTRGLAWSMHDGDHEMTAEDLRGALEASRKEAERLSGRATRAENEAATWKAAFAAAGHLPCAYCRKPIRPDRVRWGRFTAWRHVSPADELACLPIRERADRYAPPVEPADDLPDAEGRTA